MSDTLTIDRNDPLLTPKDVQRILKIGPNKLDRMIARGELRAYRIGSRLRRFDPNEVRALLRLDSPVSAQKSSSLD